jgi:hypothetical protein
VQVKATDKRFRIGSYLLEVNVTEASIIDVEQRDAKVASEFVQRAFNSCYQTSSTDENNIE